MQAHTRRSALSPRRNCYPIDQIAEKRRPVGSTGLARTLAQQRQTGSEKAPVTLPFPKVLKTPSGLIPLPSYIPVTTFGKKYPLDNLIRPYLPRLAKAVMVSWHYA